MVVKSMISVQDGIKRHLEKAYKPEYTTPARSATRKSRSGTEILTDLYARMDDLIAQIDVSDDTPAKKAIAYGSVARILQQLQAAERNQAVHINDKALEDMTAKELEEVARTALSLKGGRGSGGGHDAVQPKINVDSPSQDGSRRFNTASLEQNQENQNRESAPAKNKKQQQRALASAEARRRKAAGTHLPKAPQNTPDTETADSENVDALLDEIVRGL